MRNPDFWEKCTQGSIREAVALFIDNSPILCKYKGDKYYELEDALVSFVEKNRLLIADEVEKEFRREDVLKTFCPDDDTQESHVLATLACIDEFLDCEMNDESIKSHYKDLAKRFWGEDFDNE